MKITTENFQEAFALASKAAATSTPLEILKFVRVRAANGEMTLACNNLKAYAEARCECSSGELDVCIRADRLASALASAGEIIDLTLKGNIVTWKSGQSRYQLATLPSADFAEPRRSAKPVATIEDPEVVENLKRVVVGCAVKDIRDWALGVLVECKKASEVVMAATDGARLVSLTGEAKADADAEVVVHKESIAMLADGAERMRVFPDCVEVEYPNGLIIARTIQTKFPDWRRGLLKDKPSAKVTVDRGALTRAMKAALPFDEVGSLHFALDAGQLTIEGANKTGEKAELKVDGTGDGKVEAWFYSAAISPVIQAARGDELLMTFGAGNAPTAYLQDGKLSCVCAAMRR